VNRQDAKDAKTRSFVDEMASVPFSVRYKNAFVGNGFIDIFVEQLLVVEIKAVKMLVPIHTAQAISYLKATKLPLALILNFNTRLMRDGIERVALRVQ